ncbi:MAG: hypothetical protein M0P91_11375 [Sulfuricurvum sp.]|jgi:hypothetical protein|uniref:hypothetical protein n=1 Tax=Sulfuricurvum sp. TaxID=2025608 RepID=UPI0025FF03DD|nr:hypothetical protein [Sulfuricurvum sp.]MCK9373792.1 hypothetical protein [Sulfuricurvum sp.]
MQSITINIQELYIPRLNAFLKSLPKEAIMIQSLDAEILSRVEEYKSGKMKTTPLREGMDRIKAKIEAKL